MSCLHSFAPRRVMRPYRSAWAPRPARSDTNPPFHEATPRPVGHPPGHWNRRVRRFRAGPPRRHPYGAVPVASKTGRKRAISARISAMASPPARRASGPGSSEPGSLSAARLLAESPVGIVLLDTAGVVREANPAAARLFDVTPDDLVGRELAGWSDPDASDSSDVLGDHVATVLDAERDETEWLAA